MELHTNHRVGRYEVEAILGKGGMATVYLVRHLDLDARHAMKVLHLPAAVIQQRLLLEGKVQSQLRHPNIVAVTDMVRVHGAPGLIMEWIRGPALDALLQGPPLTWPQIDALARGILSGVAEAHRQGLVHRDLKPANILLSLEGDTVTPKVTDFGLAKLLSPEVDLKATRTGIPMGSPAYMSPEQIRDARSVDRRTDVFALGAVLFELVTGTRAFGRDLDTLELFDRIRRGDYPNLADVAPALPQSCREAIESALSTDREDRPDDAEQLLALWTDERSAPLEPWTAEDLVELEANSPKLHALSTSSLTGSSGSETFGDFGISYGDELEEGAVIKVARPTGERSRWFQIGLTAAVGVAVLALIAPRLNPPSTPVTAALSTPATPQGWAFLLDADLPAAQRAFESATTPQAQLGLFVVRRWSLQRGTGNEALWEAVSTADPTEPIGSLALATATLHRRSGPNPEADLTTYRQAHPTDILAMLLALELSPAIASERAQLIDQVRSQAPDVALGPWLQAREFLSQGRFDEAEDEAMAALQRFPNHAGLLLIVGTSRLQRGEVDTAIRSLVRSLEASAGDQAARMYLTAAYLLKDEQVRVSELREHAMAAEVPPEQRVAFAMYTATVLTGLGRVHEAVGLLDEAEESAAESGSYLTRASVIGAIAVTHMVARQTPEMAAATERLTRFIANPEIPDGERSLLVRNLLYAQGMVAARQGDLDGAKAIVARLSRLDGVGPVFIEWLEREVAIQSGDVDSVLTHFETQPPGCVRQLMIAESLDAAGASKRAAEFAKGTEGTDCPLLGEDRLLLATGWVFRAEQAVGEGRLDDASQALAHYTLIWPRPDRDLPIAVRASAVAAQL